MNKEIPYGSCWVSKQEPAHEVCVFMCYRYYSVPKYFTMSLGGHKSKLLAEDFILKHYQPKAAQKEKQK